MTTLKLIIAILPALLVAIAAFRLLRYMEMAGWEEEKKKYIPITAENAWMACLFKIKHPPNGDVPSIVSVCLGCITFVVLAEKLFL